MTACQSARRPVIEVTRFAAIQETRGKIIENLPVFTRLARQRWESIPANIRRRLLANVWCIHCHHEVTITNFSGTVKSGNLLLAGKCAECHGDVARVIEGS